MPIAKQTVLRGAPLWCGCISLEWQHVLRQEAGRYRRRLSPTFAAAPRLPDRAQNKAFEPPAVVSRSVCSSRTHSLRRASRRLPGGRAEVVD
jgi:hypothetical protein